MTGILEMARSANGYVSSAQATAEGIPRRLLAAAVASGELVRVGRGLYALPGTWEDPLLIAQHRFSKGTFSDETALYLHGMTDRAAFSLTMTFPRSFNTKAARGAGITCRTCADDVLDLGACRGRPNSGTPSAPTTSRGRSATSCGARGSSTRSLSPRRCGSTRRAGTAIP